MKSPRFNRPKAGPRVAFIGSSGIPNCYGGFEAFLENCAPEIAKNTKATIVTCDSTLYNDKTPNFHGVRRIFIPVRANGFSSIFHDLISFIRVFPAADYIFVLGVSGGVWFPLFRTLCTLTGKILLVNIDGLEWRRRKFSNWQRSILKTFDSIAQIFSHHIIYDSPALLSFIPNTRRHKAKFIAYSGDHVRRIPNVEREMGTALTICRIEPENNISMIINGTLGSSIKRHTIVGNWSQSDYGRKLRDQHANNSRLVLLDPVYDPTALANLRESCEIYIHGHSVGGTNPSLVEMLFYDCRLFCFDCTFNRCTAQESATYFSTSTDLSIKLDSHPMEEGDRSPLRARYSRTFIAMEYGKFFHDFSEKPQNGHLPN